MNRCGSFPLLSAPHSLFSNWTDLKGSEKIQGAPTKRWGEWIWLTGLTVLHRNSPQRLNISSIRGFDQIREPEIPITLRPPYCIYRIYSVYAYIYIYIYIANFRTYFPSTLYISSSECSDQGQVLHCKRRNLGFSSAECRSFFHRKLRNLGCSFTRDE